MVDLAKLFPIPDHLSVRKGDDAFKDDFPFQLLELKLNGEVVNFAIEYCISEGWVAVYKRGDDGLFIPDGEHFVSEVLTGSVEVVFKET